MKQFIKRLVAPYPRIDRRLRWVYDKIFSRSSFHLPHVSYAQLGEDLIITCLFNWLDIGRPTYLDIGAHHPTFLSNTYLLYCQGSRGVCVEPDPDLFRTFSTRRRRDTCLNVGVGVSEADAADFYIISARALNTFSQAEAHQYVQKGHSIDRVIQVPLVKVNVLMEKHFPTWPNFVSIDAEGLDLAILKSFDFHRFQPEVFCIETVTYGEQLKNQAIINFMTDRGYRIFADTYINTIFIRGECMQNLTKSSTDSGPIVEKVLTPESC